MRKIAFDLDDCIAATWQQIARRMEEEFGLEPGSLDPYDATGRTLTEEQTRSFWQKHAHDLYRVIPPADGAQLVMQRLWQEGYDISILTARQTYNPHIEPLTRQWLEDNRIPFHRLMLNCGTKADPCRQLGIGLMVEDNPRNAEALVHSQVSVLLLDQPYNRDFAHPLTIRVRHWEEIYERIGDFFAFSQV